MTKPGPGFTGARPCKLVTTVPDCTLDGMKTPAGCAPAGMVCAAADAPFAGVAGPGATVTFWWIGVETNWTWVRPLVRKISARCGLGFVSSMTSASTIFGSWKLKHLDSVKLVSDIGGKYALMLKYRSHTMPGGKSLN